MADTDGAGPVVKALRVLEAAARPGGPHALKDVASAAGATKPSAHRILATLATAGYVFSDGKGSYGPGPRAHSLAAALTGSRADDADLLLRRLATEAGETVHVALLSGDHATYVHKVEGHRPYRMASRVGEQLTLHSTAIGKAILAHLPEPERERLISSGLSRRTPGTIVDRAALRTELQEVRSRGHAIDDEENEETIRCLAAPILDRAGGVIGGVSLSTLTFDVPRERLVAHAPRVTEVAVALAPIYS